MNQHEQVSVEHIRLRPRASTSEGRDELRGRQLLSFFPGYGWYVGQVLGCRSYWDVRRLFHVRYTDLDEEELTWPELRPKLLPAQPGSEEEGGRGWEQALSMAAQAPAWSTVSAPLHEHGAEPPASGGASSPSVWAPCAE
ncbi:hypothetical protein CYMTET_6229, partial [Cymbomonas tetramitiformis]